MFFFKQKTAYEIRISDWSSDVCSSDVCSSDLSDEWKYQSRQGVFYRAEPVANDAWEQTKELSKWECDNWANGSDTSGFPASWETPDSFTATTTDYAKVGYSNRSDKCTRRVNQDKIKYTRDDANGTVFHTWIYDRISLDKIGRAHV